VHSLLTRKVLSSLLAAIPVLKQEKLFIQNNGKKSQNHFYRRNEVTSFWDYISFL